MKITAQFGNACFLSPFAQAIRHVRDLSALLFWILTLVSAWIWLFSAPSICSLGVYWSKNTLLLSSVRQVQNN